MSAAEKMDAQLVGGQERHEEQKARPGMARRLKVVGPTRHDRSRGRKDPPLAMSGLEVSQRPLRVARPQVLAPLGGRESADDAVNVAVRQVQIARRRQESTVTVGQ